VHSLRRWPRRRRSTVVYSDGGGHHTDRPERFLRCGGESSVRSPSLLGAADRRGDRPWTGPHQSLRL